MAFSSQLAPASSPYFSVYSGEGSNCFTCDRSAGMGPKLPEWAKFTSFVSWSLVGMDMGRNIAHAVADFFHCGDRIRTAAVLTGKIGGMAAGAMFSVREAEAFEKMLGEIMQ